MLRHNMNPGATIVGPEGNIEHCEHIFCKAFHMRSWNNIYDGLSVSNGYCIT
jgi:hypothetical protein